LSYLINNAKKQEKDGEENEGNEGDTETEPGVEEG
jgi:hypothetical protein